jgi:hypothetical protein
MLSSSAKSSGRLPRKWTVAEDHKLKEEVEAQSMLFRSPTIAVAVRIGARIAQGDVCQSQSDVIYSFNILKHS